MTKIWQAVLFIALILFVLAAACTPEPIETISLDDAEATARKYISLTETAQTPTLPPLPTQMPTITPRIRKSTITPTFPPTDTPGALITFTPTRTPVPTAGPYVLMTGDVNCRSGPSLHYDWKGYVLNGETANIVGKDTTGTYWLVENPDAEGTCWVWGEYATVMGSVDRIPVLRTPPTRTPSKTPTSTPAPRAQLRVETVIFCNNHPTLVMRVYNYGRMPLKSYRMQIYNSTSRTPIATIAANEFSHAVDECSLTISNLPVRDTAYALGDFGAFVDTNYVVEIQVCTDNGSKGDCVEDSFRFDIFRLTQTPTSTPTLTYTPTPTSTFTPTPSLTPTP